MTNKEKIIELLRRSPIWFGDKRYDGIQFSTIDIADMLENQQEITRNHTEKLIELLDKIKEEHPEQRIVIETPKGGAGLEIGDALIYEDAFGCIVIDGE